MLYKKSTICCIVSCKHLTACAYRLSQYINAFHNIINYSNIGFRANFITSNAITDTTNYITLFSNWHNFIY